MMALLRSRRLMFILAGAVVVGLVVSGALGLFRSLSTPLPDTSAQESSGDGGQGTGPTAPPPPDLGVLGEAPSGLSYFSDPDSDVYCDQMACVRLVMVVTEDSDVPEDTEASVEEVYDHLQSQGWQDTTPSEAPEGQTYISDGEYLLVDSSSHDDPESPAVLMLGEASGPSF